MSESIEMGIGDYEDDDWCEECDGTGWVENPCFEDTCCCLHPDEAHGLSPCPQCNPRGK